MVAGEHQSNPDEPRPVPPLRRPILIAAWTQIDIAALFFFLGTGALFPPRNLVWVGVVVALGLLLVSGMALLHQKPGGWWIAALTQIPLLLLEGAAVLSLATAIANYDPRQDRHGILPFVNTAALLIVGPLLVSSLTAVFYLIRPRTRESYGLPAVVREPFRITRRGLLYCGVAAAILVALYFPVRRVVLGFLLWEAVWGRDTAAIARLIRDGAEVDCRDSENGWTPLIAASYNGMEGVTRVLLNHGAKVNARDIWGSTPLDAATRNGHTRTAELLLERGAGTDAQDEGGGTSLENAATAGNVRLVRMLLDRGANPNLTDQHGRTALAQAVEQNQRTAARALLECPRLQVKGGPLSPALMCAALAGDLPAVQKLLRSGADPNTRDISGFSALMTASALGHREIVAALLRAGAAVDARDGYQQTALLWAAEHDRAEVADLLLRHGARPDATDRVLKETALIRAAERGHLPTVRVLLRHGADPGVRNFMGETALEKADPPFVRALLRKAGQPKPAKSTAPPE